MSTPVIAEHDVTVHQGHVLDVLPTLADGSVQCVVTSPPYYGLRDYGCDGQLGLESSPAEYVESMRAVFAEVRRVLADDGVLWLNLGDSYNAYNNNRGPSTSFSGSADRGRNTCPPGLTVQTLAPKNLIGIPWRVAFALQDDGWTLRNAIIWHKPNAMPESVTDRLSTRYEHLFLFSKSRRYWFDLDPIKPPTTGQIPGNRPEAIAAYATGMGTDSGGRRWGGNPGSTLSKLHETRNPGDVWTIPTSPFPGAHFATMPPELARRCILAGCPDGGTVLDPFAGSGTTLKVARSLGRNSVGIELNPDYIDIIRDRIGQTPLDFGEAVS